MERPPRRKVTCITDCVPFVCEQVDGRLKYISSGDKYVIGIQFGDDSVWVREGLSAQYPTGTSWRQIDGALDVVDVYRNDTWGVNSANVTYYAPFFSVYADAPTKN